MGSKDNWLGLLEKYDSVYSSLLKKEVKYIGINERESRRWGGKAKKVWDEKISPLYSIGIRFGFMKAGESPLLKRVSKTTSVIIQTHKGKTNAVN